MTMEQYTYNYADGNSSLNSTYYDNYYTQEDELVVIPVGFIVLLAFLYGSISLIAVFGNGLVILVIAKNKKMQTVTNIFIANLALADVIIGMFSIPFQFQAALLQKWVVANFMCSMAPFVKNVSVNVSVFTLTVISIDRYIAVMYPLKAGFKERVAAIVLAFIWIFSIASSIPDALFLYVTMIPENRQGDLKPFCSPHWPSKEFGKYYYLYLLLVQYLVPLVIINFSYFRIVYRIWGNKAPGYGMDRRDNIRARNKKKVVKMLIIVVCSFVLCWLPLHTYKFLSEVYPDINRYKYIHIIWFCSNWLAMSNSCYNPFIYGLLNEKFKREYRRLFRLCYGKKRKYQDPDLADYSDDSASPSQRGSLLLNGKEMIHANGRVVTFRVKKYPTDRGTGNSYV